MYFTANFQIHENVAFVIQYLNSIHKENLEPNYSHSHPSNTAKNISIHSSSYSSMNNKCVYI